MHSENKPHWRFAACGIADGVAQMADFSEGVLPPLVRLASREALFVKKSLAISLQRLSTSVRKLHVKKRWHGGAQPRSISAGTRPTQCCSRRQRGTLKNNVSYSRGRQSLAMKESIPVMHRSPGVSGIISQSRRSTQRMLAKRTQAMKRSLGAQTQQHSNLRGCSSPEMKKDTGEARFVPPLTRCSSEGEQRREVDSTSHCELNDAVQKSN
ncbi:hypothetical protein SDJN03_10347, partial [Cucurbita argyrosperma subsp. sororia]